MNAGRISVEILDGAGFALLAAGEPPRAGLRLPEPPLAPLEVLEMLGRIGDGLRGKFDPNAWVVVEADTIVSLCSITSLAEPGVPVIGYGTAPGHEGRGAASAAVASVIEWARSAPVIVALSAETSVANPASQRVLERNGFSVVGERVDDEDGPLLCWRIATS